MEEKNKILSEKFLRINVLRGLMVHKVLKGKELCKGQYPILEVISENEGCTQKYLADQLMVSPASIALSVKRLMKAGILKKDIDETNQRCHRVYLTEKGREVRKEACKLHQEIDRKTFDGFTPEEKDQLEEYFMRILNNLQGEDSGLSLFALRSQLCSDDAAEDKEN